MPDSGCLDGGPGEPWWRGDRDRSRTCGAQDGFGAIRDHLDALLANGPFAMTYGMAEGTPHDVRMQLRGEPEQPGAVVARGLIKALGGGPLAANTRGSGRLELARWLTRRDNPLTARVMVNRIWQHHFGRGLVQTRMTSGSAACRPPIPNYSIIWPTRFIASGWSIKAMHRLIVLSATYQQSSAGAVNQGDTAGALSRLMASRPSLVAA